MSYADTSNHYHCTINSKTMVAGKLTFSFIEGPLPHGGLYGKIFYFDASGRPCMQQDCQSFLYKEYGEDEREVFSRKIQVR